MNLENFPLHYFVVEYDGEFPPQDCEEHMVHVKFVDPINPDKNFNCDAIMKKEKSLDFYKLNRRRDI